MNSGQAAELKTTLVGVTLPAQKPELLEYAVRQRVEPPLLDALQSLSDEKTYDSLDDVVEDLLQVQPPQLDEQKEPREESGAPPGGDAYTEKDPTSGEVTP